MRFLGIGEAADLASLYLSLIEEGHEVKVCISDPLCKDTLAGLVDRVENWESELDWIRSAASQGCLLFEHVGGGLGALQDTLREQGFSVIGSSAYGERLETDRAYAQEVLAQLGFQTVQVCTFVEPACAIDYVARHPARYVLKGNGPAGSTYIGLHEAGEDVVALLAGGAMRAVSSFILMEHIEGVEMGVGAYFDGANFLEPACLDWEHKRFFEGDLGELTGEMGTVVTYQQTQRFFRMTLDKIEPLLRKRGYCGYINLNTIVNKEGIWPLEFTCRFGYPGYAILDPLQRIRWGELFEKMINKAGRKFETADGFCVGIVVTTPPFPYSRHRLPQPTGLPILVDGELTAAERRHLHYGEVGLKEGRLVTAGAYGSTLVVTGQGATIEQAREAANQLAAKVNVTNARYRRDIGQKLIDGNFAEIRALGLLE